MFTYSNLKSYKVRTQSRVYLGKVVDLEIDTATSQIRKYAVAKLLGKDTLLIAPEQIVKIENHEIIVSDALLKVKDLKNIKTSLAAESVAINSQR